MDNEENENNDFDHIEKMLEGMPDGQKALAKVQDDTAKEILAIAEQLVADARKKLGKSHSKPRAKNVSELFGKYAGKPPEVHEELSKHLRANEHVGKIAALDQEFDKAVATALNHFDQTSVESGGKIQDAVDTWTLAVRIFTAETRTAAAVFLACIEKAEKDKADRHDANNERESKLVRHYKKAQSIGDGLVVYEKALAKSTDELATAFGKLVKSLFTSAVNVASAEATLISASQKASHQFWTKAYAELSKTKH